MSKQRPQRKNATLSTKPASDAKDSNSQSNKEEINPTEMNKIFRSLREPWLQKRSAIIAISVVSVALMALVAWNIIKGSGDWGQGLLWGFIFGASVWLVYYGMNLFHSLFKSKKK